MKILEQLKNELTSSRIPFLLSMSAIVISLFSLWFFRFIPLQDYPDWLFQAHLITQQLKGIDSQLSYHYVTTLPTIPPNLGATVVMVLLNLVVDIEVAGKVFLSIYMLVFPLAVYLFLSNQNINHSFRWCGVLMSYNIFFFLGNLNYIIGLTLLLFAFRSIERNIHSSPYRLFIVSLGWSFVLYLSHGGTYLILVVFLFMNILFVKNSKAFTKAIIVSVALIPTAALFSYFIATYPVAGQWDFYQNIYQKLSLLGKSLLIFHRFQPLESPLPLSLINIGFLCVLSVCILSGIRKAEMGQRSNRTIALLFLCVILLYPFSNSGQLFNPEARLAFPSLFLFLSSLHFRNPVRTIELSLGLSMLIAVLLHAYQFHFYNSAAQEAYSVLNERDRFNSKQLILSSGYSEEVDRSTLRRFSGNIRPFMRLHYYTHLENGKRGFLSIFQTGLYRWKKNETNDIILYGEELGYADFQRANAVSNFKNNIVFLSNHFQEICVVGSEQTQHEFAIALQEKFKLINRSAVVGIFVRR